MTSRRHRSSRRGGARTAPPPAAQGVHARLHALPGPRLWLVRRGGRKLDGIAGDPRLWSSSGGVWQSLQDRSRPGGPRPSHERELKRPVPAQLRFELLPSGASWSTTREHKQEVAQFIYLLLNNERIRHVIGPQRRRLLQRPGRSPGRSSGGSIAVTMRSYHQDPRRTPTAGRLQREPRLPERLGRRRDCHLHVFGASSEKLLLAMVCWMRFYTARVMTHLPAAPRVWHRRCRAARSTSIWLRWMTRRSARRPRSRRSSSRPPIRPRAGRAPIGQSDVGRASRRQRKKVEILFAHLKCILRLDQLRLRGPNGARDELLLAATVQNLRKSPS